MATYPSIGGVSLENVLTWDEQTAATIPRKGVIRKPSPTTQAEYYCRTPREIIIKARATAAIKESLITLKNQHVWQVLLDYDGSTKVDDIWIEHCNSSWKGDEDENNPWLMTLELVCSTT